MGAEDGGQEVVAEKWRTLYMNNNKKIKIKNKRTFIGLLKQLLELHIRVSPMADLTSPQAL